MAMVERGQLRFSEALDYGKNGCVDEAEREITVAAEQFPDAAIVLHLEVDDFKPALLAVGQKAQKCIGSKTLAGQPVQFDDHRRWNEQFLVRRL
jgi:hypothetical protein